MKKLFALLVVGMAVLSGCAKDINAIIGSEPSVKGTVEKIGSEYAVIAVEEEQALRYSRIAVSIHAERKDSTWDLRAGDEIIVYYDGEIAEGELPRIEKVYAILYTGPADRGEKPS